jgi:hypothetical protein
VQLNYYTLITGDGRLMDRSEVADDDVEALRPIVAAGGGDLPGGLKLRVAIVPGESPGGWVFTIYRAYIPLVTCGLAMTPKAADELWPRLLKIGKRATFPMSLGQPPVPWLSVAILSGVARAGMKVVALLGDLEQCIAWTIIAGDNSAASPADTSTP